MAESGLRHFVFICGVDTERTRMLQTQPDLPLQISSALFGTVVVMAYYAQCPLYHHMFLLVTVFSVWFHTTHDPWIAVMDKVIAHMAFIMVVCLEGPRLMGGAWWLGVFPTCVGVLWVWELQLVKKHGQPLPAIVKTLHVCLHATGIVGLHFFLWVLYMQPQLK